MCPKIKNKSLQLSDNIESFKTLKAPVMTEKTSFLSREKNKFTFLVKKSANKNTIKKAFFDAFHIKPVSVNTINIKSKQISKNFGRVKTTTPNLKKAVITLKPGQKIDLFE